VREGAFDPEWALALVVSEQVRNTFLPPTALKLMRSAGVRLEPGALRTLLSAGEALGAGLGTGSAASVATGANSEATRRKIWNTTRVR